MGTAAPANILLLGVAVQDGTVPVSPTAIESAIGLNGVAVDANLAAFEWGRRWSLDPDRVEAIAGGSGARSPRPEPTSIVTTRPLPPALEARLAQLSLPGDLGEVVELLTADLVAFQDEAYARRFLTEVEAAWTAERRVAPESTRFTEAMARNLHKLMAYKDEYEVARLLLLPEATATVAEVGGARSDATWHLHPPLLKALGFDGKLAIGAWATPAFRALRAGKRLRGTRLDPFGRTEMRRTERSLIGEYLAAMHAVFPRLSAESLERAVTIASLPDGVRGYEDLKLQRVAEFRQRLAAELATWE